MTMERVALRTDAKREKRAGIAFGEVSVAQPGRRLVEGVREIRVPLLPRTSLVVEFIAGAVPELRDQGDVDRQAA